MALVVMPLGLALAIAAGVWRSHKVLQYIIGGWDPPLGVAWRADGFSAVMLVAAALLITGIGLFARAQLPTRSQTEAPAPLVFWTLLLGLWGRAVQRS